MVVAHRQYHERTDQEFPVILAGGVIFFKYYPRKTQDFYTLRDSNKWERGLTLLNLKMLMTKGKLKGINTYCLSVLSQTRTRGYSHK